MAKYEKARDDLDKNAPIWAHRINDLLKEKNITQEELAKLSGISKGTITNWFRGKKREGIEKREEAKPRIETLKLVAEALEVSVEYLYGLSESRNDDEKYKICSEMFGLSDEAMKFLHYLKWNKADKDINIEDPTRTLELINCVLKNYLFWQRFHQLLFEYSEGTRINSFTKEIVEKGLSKEHVGSIEPEDTGRTRYLLSQTFEKLIDTCKDSLYPFDLSEAISKYIEIKKENVKTWDDK